MYTIARGFVYENRALAAFDNAFEVARIEQAAGVFTEARLQDWFLDNASGIVYFFNWFYVLGYWPIILSGAVFLYIKYPQVYKKHRTVALICITRLPTLSVTIRMWLCPAFTLPCRLSCVWVWRDTPTNLPNY